MPFKDLIFPGDNGEPDLDDLSDIFLKLKLLVS